MHREDSTRRQDYFNFLCLFNQLHHKPTVIVLSPATAERAWLNEPSVVTKRLCGFCLCFPTNVPGSSTSTEHNTISSNVVNNSNKQ